MGHNSTGPHNTEPRPHHRPQHAGNKPGHYTSTRPTGNIQTEQSRTNSNHHGHQSGRRTPPPNTNTTTRLRHDFTQEKGPRSGHQLDTRPQRRMPSCTILQVQTNHQHSTTKGTRETSTPDHTPPPLSKPTPRRNRPTVADITKAPRTDTHSRTQMQAQHNPTPSGLRPHNLAAVDRWGPTPTGGPHPPTTTSLSTGHSRANTRHPTYPTNTTGSPHLRQQL